MTRIDLQRGDEAIWEVMAAVLRDWWLEHFEFVLEGGDAARLDTIEAFLGGLPRGSARDGAMDELPFSKFSSEFYQPGAEQAVSMVEMLPVRRCLFRRGMDVRQLSVEVSVWPGDAFSGMHEEEIASRAGTGTLPMPAMLPGILRFVRALGAAGGFGTCWVRLEGATG